MRSLCSSSSSTAALSSSGSGPVITTMAPSSSSWRAVSSPMPELAPVTSAVRPRMLRSMCLLLQSRTSVGSGGADEFPIDEFADALGTELTADSRTLRASEGRIGFGPAGLIDPHHSRVDPVGHALGRLDVIADDRAAEAERGVVGQRHGLILVSDRVDDRDGAEELLRVSSHRL